jgi:hypothetical protein
MVVFMDVIVTVSSAESATRLALRRGSFDEALRRHVRAQVDHLEAAALQHRRHQVLPDVVQIALDRPNHHAPYGLGARGRQQRPDDLHGRLHGARREQHLGHEVLFALEAPAHFVHGRHQASGHDGERRHSRGNGGLGGRGRGLPVSLDYGFVQFFQIRHAKLR